MTRIPCHICRGAGCACCDAAYPHACGGENGTVPYPWILPEDNPRTDRWRERWTEDEERAVAAAQTWQDAWLLYAAARVGTRSRDAVRHHWQQRQRAGRHNAAWTDEEEDVIDRCYCRARVYDAYNAEWPGGRTEAAILIKWKRLHGKTR